MGDDIRDEAEDMRRHHAGENFVDRYRDFIRIAICEAHREKGGQPLTDDQIEESVRHTMNLPEFFAGDILYRIARLAILELLSIEALPAYVAGEIEGHHEAEKAVEKLRERHTRMNHLESIDQALRFAARDAGCGS